MNRQTYPIFRKDFEILIKLTIATLAIQAAIQILYPVFEQIRNLPHRNVDEWLPRVQVAISVLAGLIAAGYWYAEEREGNHLLFLRRLPASARRIWGEKTAAGLGALAALLAIQTVWSLLIYSREKGFWGIEGIKFLLTILSFSLLAYVVGLPLSRYLKQTISVVLTGIPVVVFLCFCFFLIQTTIEKSLSSYSLKAMNLTERNPDAIFLPWFASIAILILAIYFYAILRQSLFAKPRTRIDRLSAVFFQQNRLNQYLTLGVLALLLFRFAIIGHDFVSEEAKGLVVLICAIVSIAVGVRTYTTEEKHGLRNVLYYHPVSLSHHYWTRWFCGACLTSIPILCVISYLFVGNIAGTPDGQPILHPVMILLYGLFAGLIPFACAALVTHAARNPLYAFFESVAAMFVLVLFFFGWYWSELIFRIDLVSKIIGEWQPIMLIIALPLGLALAGWRAATDREFLTGGEAYRQIYIGRLFFFLLAFLLIVFKTGWKDLFFLVTGFDIGMG